MVQKPKISDWYMLLRPQQWIKNGFVLAPLLFSGQFRQVECIANALGIFVLFCLAASAIYIINDICDRNEDRLHPTKKDRPLARNAIGTSSALIVAVVLTVVSLAGGFLLGRAVAGFLLIYLAITALYSVGLKHIAILDVLILAAGFVLRILAGSAAVAVTASYWLILCTLMIALFFGFAKRRAELMELEPGGELTRLVLRDYSLAFLDQAIAMVTSITILCYTLYTVDEHTVELFGSRAMLLTLPFVLYGVFRYIYLIYHRHKGEDPAQALLTDIPSLLNLVFWVIACLLVVLYGRQFRLF